MLGLSSNTNYCGKIFTEHYVGFFSWLLLNICLFVLNRTNESREQSHTELHMKFQQNISASNTLNTRLVHECSCVEKTHELENKDFLPGENLVLPSSSTESTQVCMAHYPWTVRLSNVFSFEVHICNLILIFKLTYNLFIDLCIER